MVLSNQTTEVINYAKDLDFEYNIKLILLGLFAITSFAAIIYAKKMETETTRQQLINKFLWGYAIVMFANSPLWILLLQRSITLDFLSNLIFKIYTIFVWIAGILIILWIIETFLSRYLGINLIHFGKNKKTTRSTNDYRRDD